MEPPTRSVMPEPAVHDGHLGAPLKPGQRLPPRYFAITVTIFVTGALGVLMVVLATEVFGSYGVAVFVMLPILLGMLPGLLVARSGASLLAGAACGSGTVACTGVMLLATGAEGVVCMLMAVPLWLPLAAGGGLVGCAVGRLVRSLYVQAPAAALILVAGPGGVTLESQVTGPSRVHAVTTDVVIDAPIECVWRNVVSFPRLAPATEWIFRMGVAAPVGAEIDGAGVGAIRRCIFTTGAFIEPITVWDEPNLLRFDVTECPAPMQEWSIYQDVHPPHLDGFLVSRQGEFRLEALGAGRTRITGTTWYEHGMAPEWYWRWWSDRIIHAIHRRVLDHIGALAESETTSPVSRTGPTRAEGT